METFLRSVRSSFQDLCLCLSGLVLACLLAVSVLRECRRFLRAHPWHVFLVLSVFSIYATVVFSITADGDFKIEKLKNSAERRINGKAYVNGEERL